MCYNNNVLKTCIKCKLDLPLDKFSVNKSKLLGVNGTCKICQRNLSRKHYSNNKQRYRLRNKLQISEYKKIISELKNNPCVDCGVKYNEWQMDFDHVRGIKKLSISVMRHQHIGKNVLLNEIAKCDLVCANCHRDRTYKRIIRRNGNESSKLVSESSILS